MAKFGVTAAYRNIPIHPPSVSPLPDLVVSSDASGSLGFGALWRTQWFFSSGFFFLASAPVHRLLELLPTVVAGHLWGHAWARLRVQFLCDNMAVVGFSSLGSSCRPASACHSSDPVITPRSASLISQCYALLAQGLAPSTRRVYAAGLRAYFQFCRSF